MSFVTKESIRVVGESVGIAEVSDEVAQALAPDVEYRIREIIQEALKFRRHSKRERMTTGDVSRALRVRNVEAVFGYSFTDPLAIVRAEGSTDLYHTEDRELDFDAIISGSLPPCPLEVAMSSHWLAIEGVQPAIPENPPPPEDNDESARALQGLAEAPPTHMVGQMLSQELQTFYVKVTNAVLNGPPPLRDAALATLAKDAGLQALLPYFTQFINDEVTRNLRNLTVLFGLMRMVRCLLASPHLHIEPYLHQLMPPILTCLVGKRLCSNPTSDNHWSLRDFAAHITASIVLTYGRTYPSLLPRVTRTLVHAFLDTTKPLTTHYGAVVGLKALGPRTVATLLLPNVHTYYTLLERELNNNSSAGGKRDEAYKVKGALLRATGNLLQAHHDFCDLATPTVDGAGGVGVGVDGVSLRRTAAATTSSSSSNGSSAAINGGAGGAGGAGAGGAGDGGEENIVRDLGVFKWVAPRKMADASEKDLHEMRELRLSEKSKATTAPAVRRYEELADIFGSSLTAAITLPDTSSVL